MNSPSKTQVSLKTVPPIPSAAFFAHRFLSPRLRPTWGKQDPFAPCPATGVRALHTSKNRVAEQLAVELHVILPISDGGNSEGAPPKKHMWASTSMVVRVHIVCGPCYATFMKPSGLTTYYDQYHSGRCHSLCLVCGCLFVLTRKTGVEDFKKYPHTSNAVVNKRRKSRRLHALGITATLLEVLRGSGFCGSELHVS